MSKTTKSFKQKMANRKANREFQIALDNASPSMRSELLAIAARQIMH